MTANSEIDVPHVDVRNRDGLGLLGLLRKVAELEARVAHLTEALTSRQQIALITGVLAERTRSNPDEAWSLMVQGSSLTNPEAAGGGPGPARRLLRPAQPGGPGSRR